MYCRKCGAEIAEGQNFCPKCGANVVPEQVSVTVNEINPGNKPKSHLVLAILVTICCCIPFGIVSILYGSKVEGAWAGGRYDEAIRCSKLAKRWAIWGLFINIVVWVAYIVLLALGIVALDAFDGLLDVVDVMSV